MYGLLATIARANYSATVRHLSRSLQVPLIITHRPAMLPRKMSFTRVFSIGDWLMFLVARCCGSSRRHKDASLCLVWMIRGPLPQMVSGDAETRTTWASWTAASQAVRLCQFRTRPRMAYAVFSVAPSCGQRKSTPLSVPRNRRQSHLLSIRRGGRGRAARRPPCLLRVRNPLDERSVLNSARWLPHRRGTGCPSRRSPALALNRAVTRKQHPLIQLLYDASAKPIS